MDPQRRPAAGVAVGAEAAEAAEEVKVPTYVVHMFHKQTQERHAEVVNVFYILGRQLQEVPVMV